MAHGKFGMFHLWLTSYLNAVLILYETQKFKVFSSYQSFFQILLMNQLVLI